MPLNTRVCLLSFEDDLLYKMSCNKLVLFFPVVVLIVFLVLLHCFFWCTDLCPFFFFHFSIAFPPSLFIFLHSLSIFSPLFFSANLHHYVLFCVCLSHLAVLWRSLRILHHVFIVFRLFLHRFPDWLHWSFSVPFYFTSHCQFPYYPLCFLTQSFLIYYCSILLFFCSSPPISTILHFSIYSCHICSFFYVNCKFFASCLWYLFYFFIAFSEIYCCNLFRSSSFYFFLSFSTIFFLVSYLVSLC